MAFPLLQAQTAKWSRAEERQLKQLAKHNKVEIISLVLGRPQAGVREKATELGIILRL